MAKQKHYKRQDKTREKRKEKKREKKRENQQHTAYLLLVKLKCSVLSMVPLATEQPKF